LIPSINTDTLDKGEHSLPRLSAMYSLFPHLSPQADREEE
jgi:hypothetical protein